MIQWGLPCHASVYKLEDGSDISIFVFGNDNSICDIGDSNKSPIWEGITCDFSSEDQVRGLIARYLKEHDIPAKESIKEYFSISCIFDGASGISGGVSVFEKTSDSDNTVSVSHRILHGYDGKPIQLEVSSMCIDDLGIWEHRKLADYAKGFWSLYS